MLYAKVIYTGVADHTHASAKQTTVCGDRFDFDHDDTRAWMTIHRGGVTTTMYLTGDVWVMNESGKTVSQYAPPHSMLGLPQ